MTSGGTGPVVVAGSTVEGEEPEVLQAFRRVLATNANSVLILAPRHPERFPEVAALLTSSSIPFWQRSKWNTSDPVSGGVFLLDTIGELGAIYQLGDIAFVGGSLAQRGGHNILEPAMYGVPVLVGPHTENFRDIIELFRRADAVTIVRDCNELANKFDHLLADPQKRRELGDRAAELVRDQSGATLRTLDAIESLLHSVE